MRREDGRKYCNKFEAISVLQVSLENAKDGWLVRKEKLNVMCKFFWWAWWLFH